MSFFRYIIFYLVFSISWASIAQTPVPVWKKCYGGSGYDGANSFVQDPGGGYVIAGYNSSTNGDVQGGHGYDDYWVVKVGSQGVIVWSRSLGGSESDDARMIRSTSDKGYVIIGAAYSNDGDITNHHGTTSFNDCWIVKLDSAGTIQWEQSYGGTSYDMGYYIIQTADKGYVFGGSVASTDGDAVGNTQNSGWLVKLDSAGVIQWQRFIAGSRITSVESTSDNGYIVTGYDSTGKGMLLKVDSVGNKVWKRTAFASNSYGDIFSAKETIDKGFIMCVTSYTTVTVQSGFITTSRFQVLKTDSLGIFAWQCTVPTADAQPREQSLWVEQTLDTGYVVTGWAGDPYANTDLEVAKIHPNGNLAWMYRLGGSHNDYGYCFKETKLNEYVVAGYTESNDGDVSGNHGGRDMWVIKFAGMVSVKELNVEEDATVYPSPTNGLLEISTPEGTQQIVVTNAVGEHMMTLLLHDKRQTLDLTNAAPGIYFLQIVTSKGTVTKKVIVNR